MATKKAPARSRANNGASTSRSARTPRSATATRGTGTARNGDETGRYTVPGLSTETAGRVIDILQERLVALLDLTLTLKHVHWNVVGTGFIGVHEMLDPQYTAASAMVDTTAERIATMGGSPNGLAGNLVSQRSWDDYSLTRAVVPQHLAEMDVAYSGLIGGHRAAIEAAGDLDPVTEDMLISQTAQLEMFQWFIRAHLENRDGEITTAKSGREAAKRAA